MSEVLSGLAAFFALSTVAFGTQNALFGRSLGITRLITLTEESLDGVLRFCLTLTVVQTASAPLCWLANRYLQPFAFRTAVRPLVFLLITLFIARHIRILLRRFAPHKGDKIADVITPASINGCVLGTLLVCVSQNYLLWQYCAFSLGSGLGYLLAVLVVSEGQRKLNRREIPVSFRGMPVMMIYIGILSLAIYGLTGHMLA